MWIRRRYLSKGKTTPGTGHGKGGGGSSLFLGKGCTRACILTWYTVRNSKCEKESTRGKGMGMERVWRECNDGTEE